MKKVISIAVVLILAAGVGVGSFFALRNGEDTRQAAPTAPQAASPVPAAERAEFELRLAALEKRVGELEAQPPLAEALQDQDVRAQLSEVLLKVEEDKRRLEEERRQTERDRRYVSYYRDRYDRILGEAREATGLDEAQWDKLDAIFDRHFEPVEATIKEKLADAGEDGWVRIRVDVNEVVAPLLPETLVALKKAMPAGGWKAFDEWRRQSETGGDNRGYVSTSRADYFLPAEEFKAARIAADNKRRWDRIERELPELKGNLALDADKEKQLEGLLRTHIQEFTATFAGQTYVNVYEAQTRDKVKPLAAKTEAELKVLLGDAGFAEFDKWKNDAGNRVWVYFGVEPPRDLRRGGGRGDRDRQPRPQPQPQPEPTRPGGGAEVF